ncbi:hypothetical protein DIRU0_E17612 [Diutina rugosa]
MFVDSRWCLAFTSAFFTCRKYKEGPTLRELAHRGFMWHKTFGGT